MSFGSVIAYAMRPTATPTGMNPIERMGSAAADPVAGRDRERERNAELVEIAHGPRCTTTARMSIEIARVARAATVNARTKGARLSTRRTRTSSTNRGPPLHERPRSNARVGRRRREDQCGQRQAPIRQQHRVGDVCHERQGKKDGPT